MHELINVKSKARVLKGVKLLETLNDAEREEIARLMKRCSYATGDTIIKQVSINTKVISIPPPSFKLVSLSLSRSSLF